MLSSCSSWRDSRRQGLDDARANWHLWDLNVHGSLAARHALHEHEFWCMVDAMVDQIKISLTGEPEKFRIKSFDAMTRK